MSSNCGMNATYLGTRFVYWISCSFNHHIIIDIMAQMTVENGWESRDFSCNDGYERDRSKWTAPSCDE